MKSILLLLLLAVSCYAQGNATSSFGTTTTFSELIPFCSNATAPSGNVSGVELCTFKEEKLKCKTFLDTANNRELIAVVEAKGVVFYQGYPISGNATPVAIYRSDCKDLFIIGTLDNTLLISSTGEVKTSSSGVNQTGTCEALGLGTIDISLIASSTAQLTEVAAEPQTSLFSFMDSYIWNAANRTLVVIGASSGNATSGGNKTDLILGLRAGDVLYPEILFQGAKLSFTFNNLQSQFFTKGGSTFLVGPVWPEITPPPEESLRVAARVEIWDLSNPASPVLVSTLNITGAKFVAVNENATALYVASLSQGTSTSTSNTTNTTEVSDVLWLIDMNDVNNPVIVGNRTYEDMRAAAEGKGVTFSDEATNTGPKNITALKVSKDDLWLGWNTGELAIYEIEEPFNPELVGFLNILTGNTTTGGTPSTPEDEELNSLNKGVSDICPSLLNEYRAWITGYDNTKGGSLFIGVQVEEEEEGTSTAEGTATAEGTSTAEGTATAEGTSTAEGTATAGGTSTAEATS